MMITKFKLFESDFQSRELNNPKWLDMYNKIAGGTSIKYSDSDGNKIEFRWEHGKLFFNVLGSFWMSSSGEDYGHKSITSGIVPDEDSKKWNEGDETGYLVSKQRSKGWYTIPEKAYKNQIVKNILLGKYKEETKENI